MIISQTPFRISFFGGATDYPTWYREYGGAVLATTINKYCYISCRILPPFFEHKHRIVYSKIETVLRTNQIEHPSVRATIEAMNCSEGLEIHHNGDLPARSGIGSSSAFTVGLIHALSALSGKYINKRELAKKAIHIEQDILQETVGCQDQISSAYGGFNRINFAMDDSFEVIPMIINPKKKILLEQHLMLFFTGLSRYAPEIAKSQVVHFRERKQELASMKAMVNEACSILQSNYDNLDSFGKLLHETWRLKKSLAKEITNSSIDAAYSMAMQAGAIGGKLLGAGGGGFMLFFVPPDRQTHVAEKLNKLLHVPFEFESTGSKIAFMESL